MKIVLRILICERIGSTSNRGSGTGLSRAGTGTARLHRVHLDNARIADIYAQTVKLAQHGKITQKNAWELQLTDHMTGLFFGKC